MYQVLGVLDWLDIPGVSGGSAGASGIRKPPIFPRFPTAKGSWGKTFPTKCLLNHPISLPNYANLLQNGPE